jgi:hypothetical protein
MKLVSFISIVSLLSWTIGWSGWVFKIKNADAAKLKHISDVISDSDVSVAANHTVSFQTQSPIGASSTIAIDFPDSFSTTSTPAFSFTDATDFDIASSTLELAIFAKGGCTGGSGPAKFEISSIATSTGTNVFTFTHCNGTDALAGSASTTIKIGTHTVTGGTGDSRIVNAPVTGSYEVAVTAPAGDSATTRIAIVDDVTVTARVATNFTFTVTALTSGTINGDATTVIADTTATTIPFGTVASGTPKVGAHQLTVSTNAKNGFTVGVFQDQNLTSGDGADIDAFKDGNGQFTPTAWTSPTTTLDDENTYGHFGVTSEDSDLNGNEFGTALYAAVGTSTPRTVFSHGNPANGITADKGKTKVGYKIEIGDLQEAADDYTNTLTYIATPTF